MSMLSQKAEPASQWMALWFPRLSIDRWRRDGGAPADGRPFALYAKLGNAFTLSAADASAAKAGLSQGMPLTDARAIRPDLVAQEADVAADLRLLDGIAAWCERFTPVVALDPPDGLFLDVGGCAHLFGGEAALLREVEQRLAAQGLAVRAALASNPSAAWAVARFGERRLVEAPYLRAALSPLPIAALRLSAEATALLKRLGIRRVGQILDAPRRAFAARAGQAAMLRLDQALGRAPEALSPRRPPPPVFALRRLAEPVLTLDAVLSVVGDLCPDLCRDMDQAGAGARRLRLCLFGTDGGTRAVELGLSRPERDPKPILRLLRERLSAVSETLDSEFGFEALRLDAVEIAPVIFTATDLAPVDGRDKQAEARLVDRLAARLGPERVGWLSVRDAHAPERASFWGKASFGEKCADAASPPSPPGDGIMRRPLSLFARAQPIEAMASVPDGPPLRFRWRRVLHEIVRAEGPERIAPNWLRARAARTRDYYRVEDKEGRRFWLYREGFYEETEAPRWFLHGLFA